MEIHEAISICNQKGIKVYPVYHLLNWYIEVNVIGKIKRYNKQITKKEISKAHADTYIFFAKKIEENSFN